MQISTSITIDGLPAVINVPPGTKAWYRANSIFSPVGPAHGTAWFVVTKSRLDSIIAYGSSHTITWTQVQRQPTADDKVLSFPNWYLLSSERLLHGGNDPSALHMLTLVDARYVAQRNSDSGIVHTNVRSYANSADYLTGTSGGTWTSVLTALWDSCNVLGAYPGLPFAPDGVPTNHRLIGNNAYVALCKLLDQLDCAICPNPLLGTFSIVQLGAAQTLPDNPGVLQWDGSPTTGIPGPATVRVYFPIHRKSYGQESDTELANNWSIEKPASVLGAATYIDTATGLAGGIGRVALWDDLPDVLDEENAETVSGSAAIAARAAARTSRYLTRRATTPAHKIYAGLVDTILPGAQVRAVLWRNWDDEGNDLGGGTVTEYRQQADLIHGVAADVYTGFANWLSDTATTPEKESYSPPDLGRSTYPTYPRLPNIVQVYQSVGTQGQTVSPNGTAPGSGAKLHSGRVKRWVANDMETYDDCWILFVDDYDNALGDTTAIDGDYYGPARLSGMTTDDIEDGQQLPIYTVRQSKSAETGMLIAALYGDEILEHFDSSSGNYSIIGDEPSAHGTVFSSESTVALPSATAAIYEPVIRDGACYYNILEESATVYNGSPWEYRGDDTADPTADTQWEYEAPHLMYVEKHNGLYIVRRAVNWTPRALFYADAFTSTGTISNFQFDFDEATEAGNVFHGNIAEPWASGGATGIKFLAPGYRQYKIDLAFTFSVTMGTTVTDFRVSVAPNTGAPGLFTNYDWLILSGGTTKISNRSGSMHLSWYVSAYETMTYVPCQVTAVGFTTSDSPVVKAMLTVTPMGV